MFSSMGCVLTDSSTGSDVNLIFKTVGRTYRRRSLRLDDWKHGGAFFGARASSFCLDECPTEEIIYNTLDVGLRVDGTVEFGGRPRIDEIDGVPDPEIIDDEAVDADYGEIDDDEGGSDSEHVDSDDNEHHEDERPNDCSPWALIGKPRQTHLRQAHE